MLVSFMKSSRKIPVVFSSGTASEWHGGVFSVILRTYVQFFFSNRINNDLHRTEMNDSKMNMSKMYITLLPTDET